jgi:hypothetical protein
MRELILTFGALLFLFLCGCDTSNSSTANATIDRDKTSLQGSWSIEEIHWHTKDTTYSILEAQPGYFLFTEASYALMWTRTKEPRIAFANLSNPTSDEKIAAFQTLVFNSGSYQVRHDTIISEASIAKVPGFEGGRQFYTFKQDRNHLDVTMYDETYPNGSKPEWSGVFTVEFKMKKVSD